MTHSTWGTWQNASLFIIASSIIINNQLSRHRDLAGCDRYRVSGSMPYTVCHATSCRRTIALHLRLPTPCAPLGSSSPSSYAGLLNHPIVLLVFPFAREFCKDGTLMLSRSVLRLAFLYRPPRPTSALERDNRGCYQSLHSFTPSPSYNGVPPFYAP